MACKAVAKTIRTHFADHFDRAPIAWPNVDFEPQPREAWVRLTILDSAGRQVATAPPRFRRSGVVVVQVFVPDGTGDAAAREIADEVARVFQGSTIDGVRFGASSIEHVGPDGGWFQLNVQQVFEYEVV